MSPHIAVVGSGPAGMYLADAVLRLLPSARVTVLESLPVPFGLVRAGVAPDHPEVKAVLGKFQSVMGEERVTFAGNVSVGSGGISTSGSLDSDGSSMDSVSNNGNGNRSWGDVTVRELQSMFDAVALCHGPVNPWHRPGGSGLSVGIEGEEEAIDAGFMVPAQTVVASYNAHTCDLAHLRQGHFDLARGSLLPDSVRRVINAERVHILGQGNVSLDIARILLGNPDRLAKTDTSVEFMDALYDRWNSSSLSTTAATSTTSTTSSSSTSGAGRDIAVVGRRGPVNAAFTTKEFKELVHLGDHVKVAFEDDAFKSITDEIEAELKRNRPKRRLVETMRKAAAGTLARAPESVPDGLGGGTAAQDICRILFHRIPVAIDHVQSTVTFELGVVDPKTGKATGIGEFETVETDAVVRSVGYNVTPCDPWIPVDSASGRVPNRGGRVIFPNDSDVNDIHLSPVYISGWLRTGPQGVIASTMMDAKDVASNIAAELAENTSRDDNRRDPGEKLIQTLKKRGVRVVDKTGWNKIDASERCAGEKIQAPRVKLLSVEDMLDLVE